MSVLGWQKQLPGTNMFILKGLEAGSSEHIQLSLSSLTEIIPWTGLNQPCRSTPTGILDTVRSANSMWRVAQLLRWSSCRLSDPVCCSFKMSQNNVHRWDMFVTIDVSYMGRIWVHFLCNIWNIYLNELYLGWYNKVDFIITETGH